MTDTKPSTLSSLDLLLQRIDNDFTYHRPPPEAAEVFVELREKAKEFAVLIATKTPMSREQSIALTNLETAVFFANAAIARRYPADASLREA